MRSTTYAEWKQQQHAEKLATISADVRDAQIPWNPLQCSQREYESARALATTTAEDEWNNGKVNRAAWPDQKSYLAFRITVLMGLK